MNGAAFVDVWLREISKVIRYERITNGDASCIFKATINDCVSVTADDLIYVSDITDVPSRKYC